MNKVLVIGASSGIGLETTKLALEQGLSVKAFSRSANKIDITHGDLEKVAGNALSGADVEAAVKDCDAVVMALGVPANLKLLTGPITLFSEATRVLIPIMQKHNVKRLICVTGFGAGECIDAINPIQKIGFNMVFGRAYADKSVQEDEIIKSDLDWTIVRPGVLTSCSFPSSYRVLADKQEWKNGLVSRKSVAEFIVKELKDNQFIHKAPVLIA